MYMQVGGSAGGATQLAMRWFAQLDIQRRQHGHSPTHAEARATATIVDEAARAYVVRKRSAKKGLAARAHLARVRKPAQMTSG